jgi:mono/diheme cytochrome c family protein
MLAFALIAAASGAAPALADDASPTGAVMSKGWVFDEHGGAELFGNVCAACHQANAKGAAAAGAYPALAADKKLASTEFVLTVLLQGQRSMPPVGQMMSDEQVADVVNYVRTHFGNSYPGAASAAQVAAARSRTATPP